MVPYFRKNPAPIIEKVIALNPSYNREVNPERNSGLSPNPSFITEERNSGLPLNFSY